MRNLTCPHCEQTVPVPDELTKAHCVRCGQAFELETNIMAAAPPVEAYSDRPLGDGGSITLPDRWSSWEEFRANSPAVQRELMQLASRALPDMRRMNVQPVPEDAPPEMDDWGRPVAMIQIPGDRDIKWVLHFLCLLFLVGGSTLVGFGAFLAFVPGFAARHFPNEKGMDWATAIYGTGAIAIAAFVWYSHKPKPPTILWLFDEGIFARRYGRSVAVGWDQIQDFESTAATGRPLYWLTFSHDFSVAISVGFSPEIVPIMEYIEIRLSAAQLLRRLEAIWEGQPQRFGIVRLDRQGFGAPRFFARWSEVRRVVSDAQHLFVDWTGVSEWSSLRYRDVSFPYLVMAISHVMIDEHSRFPKADA